jgi:hypothetical protein
VRKGHPGRFDLNGRCSSSLAAAAAPARMDLNSLGGGIAQEGADIVNLELD